MRHVAAMHADQPASPRGLASHAAAAVTATNGPPVHHQLPLGSFSSPTSSHPEPSSRCAACSTRESLKSGELLKCVGRVRKKVAQVCSSFPK